MPLPVDVKGGPAQLTWYIGQDDCLYAHELQTNCLFKIIEDISSFEPGPAPAPGVPEAPTDGQIYGRENASWGVVPTEAASLAMISPDGQSAVTLTLVNGGDVVATQQSGPNAGKSVNLTYGKWV
jgi:hypothetical protein